MLLSIAHFTVFCYLCLRFFVLFIPLTPASAEFNAWSYTSTPQYVIMA